MEPARVDVSIVIPVLNKLEFTRQCLDRIWRDTGDTASYDVVVVDNGSTDGTPEWFAANRHPSLRYHRNDRNLGFAKANNIGVSLSRGEHLLFLNNDTLVRPGWLSEMLRVLHSDRAVGIVGIKQLFPYTNSVYHTGVVFAPGAVPQHLYPHLDASLPQVNQEREYQAVNGACLLIPRALFDECGQFDEAYLNGYEDTDLCMQVRQRGRKVVCCTSAYIYHYAQISEGRTADDDQNAALFASRWADRVRIDQHEYFARDAALAAPARKAPASAGHPRLLPDDCVYLADDLGHASAFTWVNVELALALREHGVPVLINGSRLSPTIDAETRRRLAPLAAPASPVGGVQIKWSHYWERHLDLELHGRVDLEFFVINYLFGRPGSEPWDYWLQSVRQNGRDKLPVSDFCASVLEQVGVPQSCAPVLYHGYSREIDTVEAAPRRDARFRILTVTNSHDLPRYNTAAIVDAFEQEFSGDDSIVLVIKDYGASAADVSLRERLQKRAARPPIDYVSEFTDKRELIRLYRSCDAFVSAHRGEGFGMKILDAMACGLPVVTPLFGGPTAYCSEGNCLPVAFHMVPVSDGVDAKSLTITNHPIWAEVEVPDLRRQMRTLVNDRVAVATLARAGQSAVLNRFSWSSAAARLTDIVTDAASRRHIAPRTANVATLPARERSPYWLGLRVSVVIPTHNRKAALSNCLDALARQSILPQEFEVVIVDDGSTDGTSEAVEARHDPFQIRYLRQEPSGPGAARNLGVQHAAGELVLFIGDDIYADERLLEEHLLAHVAHPYSGDAVLGHIDWPASMTPNAVMEYVCGEGMLQFAFPLIAQLPALDHRFFYTSNISLKRSFLTEAAEAGVVFDKAFRHAAFEDSELALRLESRGLRIHYAGRARAVHDHVMDLESFSRREHRAGEMAVVFYRKHPGHDDQLQVRWLADLVRPAQELLRQPELIGHLESFDAQTDALLRSLAGSLEELLAMGRHTSSIAAGQVPAQRVRASLHNVLRVIFDVERTRGKVQEWFAGVGDAALIRAAQLQATVLRKVDFLGQTSGTSGPMGDRLVPFDPGLLSSLKSRLGGADNGSEPSEPVGRQAIRSLRRALMRPTVVTHLVRIDRSIQARLKERGKDAWLAQYQRLRGALRRRLG